MAWKNEKMFHVQNKVNNLKQKVKPKNTNPVLQLDYVIKYLKNSYKISLSSN